MSDYGRTIAEAVSRWLPTAEVRFRGPGLVKWDVRWSRFSPSTSVSPANLNSTNFSIITFTRGSQQRPCDELITRSKIPADCPRYSNWNETESLTEEAEAQNWAVEPQEKSMSDYLRGSGMDIGFIV
jgi:hypothetical protein